MLNKKYLYWASLGICFALYFVWPTTHTIALRKLLLLCAAVAAVFILHKSEVRKEILVSPWLMYAGLLFVWLIFHAIFISQNGAEAWSELRGQWVPPYLAFLGGMGLALAGRIISPRMFRFYLYAMLAAQPLYYLFFTLIKSIQTGHLAIGAGNWGLTDHKMSLTFYADLLVALACAKIIGGIKSGTPLSKFFPWIVPVILAIYVAVFSDSLNGIILVGGCLLLTLMVIVYLGRKKISGSMFAVAMLMATIAIYLAGSSSYMTGKLENLAGNTRIAVNIDTYTNWQNFMELGLPKDEQGVQVKESYYLRVAYATAGLRTIIEHPWGYGVTRHAFERLIQQKYPGSSIANSHNAYIDLVSAAGFPALILLVMMIVSVYSQLHRSSSEWSRPAAWMIGVIVAHWMLDPISRDHYFETFLFLVGLFATLTYERRTDNA